MVARARTSQAHSVAPIFCIPYDPMGSERSARTPKEFRKILFVLKHDRRGLSLASYYLNKHGHLVPDDVEVWEFDTSTQLGKRLR